ncbi:TPA: H-NS histone family protein [Burkholderia cenocepacia]|nr:H-NS histone family protein [Burkholderia cenocepacia]HDR9888533.1 H-NS histone family protein [Burkholderia cenocepacia]
MNASMSGEQNRALEEYEELLEKRRKIDIELVSLRVARRGEMLKYISTLIDEFGLEVAEIEKYISENFGKRKVRPKYFDPVSGATWSGRGKTPRWLVGRDPEEFLIKE